MRNIARSVIKWANSIALIGTLLGLAGLYFSARLYSNLRPDIEELLPSSTRSVTDFREVSRRLKSVESMVTLVFSDHPDASRRFVVALGEKLKSVPEDTISLTVYNIDHELKFFTDRQALFLDTPDLLRIKDYVRNRIDWEKKTFFSIFPISDMPPKPTLDFESIKKKYQSTDLDYTHFRDGFYATPDEKVRAVVTYMPGKGLEKATRMANAVKRAVGELNPKSFSPDLEVKYTGNAENLIEESAALVADLEFSTVVVVVLVTLAMLLFYRSVRATISLVFSLFMGTFWTFGIAYFAVSYLNANTAFLASIVIGNGINCGIIMLARYVEERRKGLESASALETAMVATASTTAVAALASGLSYGSLMLTGFRGFNQFGLIGLVGMILCWISSYTLLPAYLVIFDRLSQGRWGFKPASGFSFAGMIATTVDKFSPSVCLLTLFAAAISISTLFFYDPNILETDLSKLKDKYSIQHGSGYLYHYIDDIFGHSFSPLVVLPNNREDTRKIASLFRTQKEKDGTNSLLSEIETLDDFVPEHQAEKQIILKDIQQILKPKFVERLSAEDRKMATTLLAAATVPVFSENDLPPMILSRFTEKDGSRGKIVLVDKVIDKSGKDDAKSISSFVRMVRDITDSVAPGAPVAGPLPVIYDMLEAISDDGPRATLFAFLAVVALVILLFRQTQTIALSLFALSLGVLWLAGIILGFHLKINFLNFIALPITFGIGVDYGVNIFQRYRKDNEKDVLNVVRYTGGAVILCSLTTVIGYGSLLIAGNQAFVSFGRLAVFGELTCITAAIVGLPAFLRYQAGRRKEGSSNLAENKKVAA